MTALIGNPSCGLPQQLNAYVQDESTKMAFNMSPLGTPEAPGQFHDANVLGMDFLEKAGLSMTVDTPINLFRLHKRDHATMSQDYPDEATAI
jgi:hypothetical protein